MKKPLKSLPSMIQKFLDSSQLPDESTVRQLVRLEPELATLLILEQAIRWSGNGYYFGSNILD